MAFGFDITDGLKFGDEDNVMAVKVDNSYKYKEKATAAPVFNGIRIIFMPITAALIKTCTCI